MRWHSIDACRRRYRLAQLAKTELRDGFAAKSGEASRQRRGNYTVPLVGARRIGGRGRGERVGNILVIEAQRQQPLASSGQTKLSLETYRHIPRASVVYSKVPILSKNR